MQGQWKKTDNKKEKDPHRNDDAYDKLASVTFKDITHPISFVRYVETKILVKKLKVLNLLVINLISKEKKPFQLNIYPVEKPTKKYKKKVTNDLRETFDFLVKMEVEKGNKKAGHLEDMNLL